MARREDAFLGRVRASIAAHAMLRPGDRVMAAVSGGADSVAMLHALRLLEIPLEVAHLDHQTRGGESQADAAFVRALAAELGAPFHLASRPVAREARQAGLSFEQHARVVRYDFLLRVAAERGCAALATAHHADDAAETVLMRLLRGCGPSGLAGVPPVRAERGVRIIRPLIDCARAEVEAWLRAQNIIWREDATNRDPRFRRNKVRHDLLPELAKSYNPRLREALLRLAEAQRLENDALDRIAADALAACLSTPESIARAPFRALHEAIRRRAVLRIAWDRQVEIPFERVADAALFIADAPTGQYFDLGGGVSLYSGRHTIEILHPGAAAASSAGSVPLPIPGEAMALGRHFSATLALAPPPFELAAWCGPNRQVFDADALGARTELRARRAGDRFRPLGMEGVRKLKDYFIDIGIPAPRRDAIPLLIANERIVWVVGHAPGAEAAVTPATKRWVNIEVTP